MLRGTEPTAEERKAFDVSLILYAEHEFNASTFAARVVTSTEVRPALGHRRGDRGAEGPRCTAAPTRR